MPNSLTNVPNSPLVTGQPSDDIVHFQVEVDRSRCMPVDPAIDARLQNLETSGLSLRISGIVARSAIHFIGSVLDAGEGYEVARVRLAWHILMDWQMNAVPHRWNPKRTVLTIATQPNSRLLALRTEIISMGIALEIGIRMFGIPYPFWDATAGLQPYDLHAYDPLGNLIAVEARGRTDRNGCKTAVQQIYRKFKTPNFSQAAGIVFFPRTTNKGRASDIMVIDPEGEAPRRHPNQRYRSLLRHYAPFFISQGNLIRRFGDTLRAIAEHSEREFENYLANGIPSGDSPFRRGHSGFTFRGERYVGTFWDDVVWPEWLTGIRSPARGGVFFWGLARNVIDSLRTGQIRQLEFPPEETVVKKSDSQVTIAFSDRTIVAWAPSSNMLI